MDNQSVRYAIRIREPLGALEVAFDDLTILQDELGTTLIGDFADQAALHGVLARIRDLCLTLVTVERINPVP